MALEPIARTVDIATKLSAANASAAVSNALRGVKGAQEGAPGWLRFRLGSAAWLRTWGLWTPRAYRHLPLTVDVSVTDLGNERRVRLDFRSAEGPYLVRLNRIEPAYDRRFEELLDTIKPQLT